MPVGVRRSLTIGLALLCASTGAALLTSAPALASTPETPQVVVRGISANRALLEGVVNPDASAAKEAGTYQFVYRASSTGECKGAGEVRLPASPAVSMGLAHEELPYEEAGGLAPDTEYAACLVVTEPGKTEAAISPVVTFKTRIPPEVPLARPATEITGTSATLHGLVNPGKEGEAGTVNFVYSPSASECEAGVLTTETAETQTFGKAAEIVSTVVSGLLPRTTYAFCVRALNAVFEDSFSAVETFTTGAAPVAVSEESVGKLGSNEATVRAEIAPGGVAATYEVEYEPGKRTPAQSLPASVTAVPVSQRLTGLQPGTEYHFRFIAHSELGAAEGAEEEFTTPAAVSFGGGASSGCPNSTLTGFSAALPDCRAVELVSPANEVGDVYDPGESLREEDITTARPFRAAAGGGTLAYLADPGPVGGDGSSAKGRGNEYLAIRGPLSGPQGWETSDITPPIAEEENASFEREYVSFSDDLSVGLVASEAPLLAANPSPQGPPGCQVLYSRNSGAGLGGEFHALFTETQTPGQCGEIQNSAEGRDGYLIFTGESADHAQKFFQTPIPLTQAATEAELLGGNLYDSLDDGLSQVNQLPGGGVDPNATFGGPSELLQNPPDLSRAISADGSRVFWSTLELGENASEQRVALPQALYAREQPSSPSASTVQLDTAQSGASGASGGGLFRTASSDGSKVFFTDCKRLTVDSTADPSEGCQTGSDLYEYDFTRPVGERLTDLTVDRDAGDALGANVRGVIGASEDGSYVYFVAGGTLESATNSRMEGPEALGDNLYVEHYGGGEWETPRFIAALAAHDNEVGFGLNSPFAAGGRVYGDWRPNLGSRTAEVSSDGHHLVFQSSRRLTGYDTGVPAVEKIEPALHEEIQSEVFVYSAGTGDLSCASCDPTGAPFGRQNVAQHYEPAAYLPVSSSNTFMERWMNAEGTEVFFDSSQPLISGDSNGVQDVYEWKADGTSGCPAGAGEFGGCVFLLSGGESSDFSFLVDVSENGEDVFITHRGQLDGVGPRDDKVHMYDVRVDGGFPDIALACTGTGCQGVPPAPPSFVTPSSVTFSGAGNFPQLVTAKKTAKRRAIKCAKGKKLDRGRCVKKKAKKKIKSKKTVNDRRASR
jgi:hypothetical protein